jgi:hypothetical protein
MLLGSPKAGVQSRRSHVRKRCHTDVKFRRTTRVKEVTGTKQMKASKAKHHCVNQNHEYRQYLDFSTILVESQNLRGRLIGISLQERANVTYLGKTMSSERPAACKRKKYVGTRTTFGKDREGKAVQSGTKAQCLLCVLITVAQSI